MQDMMFSIVQFLLVTVIGVIARYIIPWIKEKLNAEKLTTLGIWVKAAVAAAEQVITGSTKGIDKKAYVVDYLNRQLTSKGIKVTDEQLNILIEAAVKEMNATKININK